MLSRSDGGTRARAERRVDARPRRARCGQASRTRHSVARAVSEIDVTARLVPSDPGPSPARGDDRGRRARGPRVPPRAGGASDQPVAGTAAAQLPEGVPPDVDSLITAIVDTITDAQIVRCPYDGTVFEKDGACTHIDTCPGRLPDGSKHGRICYYCGKKWCDVDPQENPRNHKNDWKTNPKRCIWFLENQHPHFREGNGLAALQDFHKWRCMRMLYERLYTKVAASLWRDALAKRPDLLQNLYGNEEHPEGVSISTAEVASYGDHAAWSEQHDCWVGTRADFTGRMP